MSAPFEWFEDVLRPLNTRLFEDPAKTARLGFGHDGLEVLVLEKPYIVFDNDVLRLSRRPPLVDRLLRRRPFRLVELVRVRTAGATFTWVERAWGGSQRGDWKAGDNVDIIAVNVR